MAINWKETIQRFNPKGASEVWQTQDEIAYIVALGIENEILPVRQSERRWRVAPDRKTLLKNYLTAAERRVQWEGMNKQPCLLVAALLLEGQD